MPHPDPRSPVTLEQLLQLKRAERPAAEFWTKFDAELRQKQLAALVQRRSWWQELPLLFARRAYLPIGAAAVLTFTFVSVRYYTPNHVELGGIDLPAPVARVTAPATPRPDKAPVTEVASLSEQDDSDSASVAALDDRTAVAAVPLSQELPTHTDELLPWSARTVQDTPSARSIAANLARLEETEPELLNSLLGPRMNETSYSMQDAAVHAVQFAAIGGIASRRNRLLAALQDRQFTQDPTAPEVVRERLARRLGDTEISGGWTRVGVKADRVSLKF